jgi:hypothetical protein
MGSLRKDGREFAFHELRGILALEDGPGGARPEERSVGVHELMLCQTHDALLGDDVRARAGARILERRCGVAVHCR